MGVPGHLVLFALLADPYAIELPVREIADIAGVGKTTVANTLDRLAADGLLVRGVDGRQLLHRDQILDRWLAGYTTLVGPRMMIGTFQVKERTAEELEPLVGDALGDTAWAWGGGAAAMRLTGHYRGEEAPLHVETAPNDLARRLRAVPAKEGTLTILETPGRIAFEGAIPRTVHPLLVYTELLAANDERAREAAAGIRGTYLRTVA